MKTLFRRALDLGILAVALPLLAMLILLPPVGLLSETIELAHMREQTVGNVLDVSTVHGERGLSRARIRYEFRARGRRIVSDRYVPGFLGNSGTWTGGAKVAGDFRVGQPVTVYYSADEPTLCALEYGWFWLSVSLSITIGGAACVASARSRPRQTKLVHALRLFGAGSIVYGFATGFLGPNVVRVRELPWHLLGWCGALGVAAIYAATRRRSDRPIQDPTGGPSAKCVLDHDSHGPAN